MIFLITHIILNMLGLLGLFTGTLRLFFTKSNKEIEPRFSFLGWGWSLYTIGILFGSFYSKSLYNAFWVWDIKEIMSLITVIIYLGVLSINRKNYSLIHLILALLGLISAIITIILPKYLLSYHAFT